MRYPPYSPDLSPCDYGIFGHLEKALRCKRITSDDDAKQYVRNWFTTQPREYYETAIHRLVSLCVSVCVTLYVCVTVYLCVCLSRSVGLSNIRNGGISFFRITLVYASFLSKTLLFYK